MGGTFDIWRRAVIQSSPLPLRGGGTLHRCFDTLEDSTSTFQFARWVAVTLSVFPLAEGLGIRNVGCIGLLWDGEVHPWLSTCVYFGVKLILCPAGCRVDCLSGGWRVGGSSSSEGHCTVGQIHSCSEVKPDGCGEGLRGI